MSPLMSKAKSGVRPPLIPEDTYHAVCYGVVDLGTQETIFGAKQKVIIFWELPDERMDVVDQDGEKISKPRVISNRYTNSIHEKATLGQLLTSWQGRPFTQEERDDFDLFRMIGTNCLLGIVHNKVGDDVYANVGMVVKLMKGQEIKKPENPMLRYSIQDNGLDIPEGIYDWVKDIIKKSAEHRGTTIPNDSQTQSEGSDPCGPVPESEGSNEGIPF